MATTRRAVSTALRQGAPSGAAGICSTASASASSASRSAAVCVYHAFVETAVEALEGTGIPVAAVSTGFPAGLVAAPAAARARSRRRSPPAPSEIDIVITRAHVLTGDWQALYDEVNALREACGDAHLKTILATGELARCATSRGPALVCMMAGADFIKTSTGKEKVNATLPVGLVMVARDPRLPRADRRSVGFKPAGGIRTAKDALDWLALMKEELGDRWLEPDLFRFGASRCSTDIERQLEHPVDRPLLRRSPPPA